MMKIILLADFRDVELRREKRSNKPTPTFAFDVKWNVTNDLNGGDLASTRVAKPEVHAELQTTRKTVCKTLVANDDNYALAA
jgi:hypothetical protein